MVVKCGKSKSMGKPLVHVKDGSACEQLVADAVDALVASGNYSEAMELNALLTDAVSAEVVVQEVLRHVEVCMD